jgi:hypothetical protein
MSPAKAPACPASPQSLNTNRASAGSFSDQIAVIPVVHRILRSRWQYLLNDSHRRICFGDINRNWFCLKPPRHWCYRTTYFPMSALGQKQTCATHKPMSALPPIAKADFGKRLMPALPLEADMCGALAHFRYGPKADIACPTLWTGSCSAWRGTLRLPGDHRF